MKRLQVTFEHITDTTGYLFSLMKCLSASLSSSEYRAYAEDIVASSGFAFRMWVDGKGLCPSATSIWNFQKQKEWVENGGLTCEYVQRMWDEDALDEERRLAAIEMIERSIDAGVAPVGWDLSGCEWGLVTGYDAESQVLQLLTISGTEKTLPYEKLGRLDIPILSVLTVTGQMPKTAAQLVADTKKLAASHLRGEEWCSNAKGLASYDALIAYVMEQLSADTAWNLEYYLGTYGGLKWYAWKFFEKYGEQELAELYQNVYKAWKKAFDCKMANDVTQKEVRVQIAEWLKCAQEAEVRAVEIMAAE